MCEFISPFAPLFSALANILYYYYVGALQIKHARFLSVEIDSADELSAVIYLFITPRRRARKQTTLVPAVKKIQIFRARNRAEKEYTLPREDLRDILLKKKKQQQRQKERERNYST